MTFRAARDVVLLGFGRSLGLVGRTDDRAGFQRNAVQHLSFGIRDGIPQKMTAIGRLSVNRMERSRRCQSWRPMNGRKRPEDGKQCPNINSSSLNRLHPTPSPRRSTVPHRATRHTPTPDSGAPLRRDRRACCPTLPPAFRCDRSAPADRCGSRRRCSETAAARSVPASSRSRRSRRARITGGHRRIEIGRRREQRAVDLARGLPRPVHGNHHPRAVRDEDHGAVDRGQRRIERRDACGAAQLVGFERRDGACVRQASFEVRLPVSST